MRRNEGSEREMAWLFLGSMFWFEGGVLRMLFGVAFPAELSCRLRPVESGGSSTVVRTWGWVDMGRRGLWGALLGVVEIAYRWRAALMSEIDV